MTPAAADVVVAEIARSLTLDGEAIERRLLHVLADAGWDRDRARSLVGKALRPAAGRLLQACRLASERSVHPPSGVTSLLPAFRAWGEIQDADVAAGRVYGAFSSYMNTRDGDLWRAITERADRARKEALLTYAKGDTSSAEAGTTLGRIAADGWVRAAVLGSQATFADFRVAATGPDTFGGTVAGAGWEAYGRPVVAGYWHVEIQDGGSWREKDGPRVVAVGMANAVLRGLGGRGLLIERIPDPDRPESHVTDPGVAAIRAGRVSFRTQDGILTAYVPRVLELPAVPVGTFEIKHLTLAGLGHDGAKRVLEDLVRTHRYHYVGADAKKRETPGRAIARTKDGRVKWIQPDPFARTPAG